MKMVLQVFFKGLYFFLTDGSFRKFVWYLIRYGNARRYSKKKISLLNSEVAVADAKSFIWQFYEIFFKRYYHFQSPGNNPLIIDCGANIGLSVINFKKQYPSSVIHAFEPDKNIYGLLNQNVNSFKLQNVNLHNEAVWIEDTELSFASEGADGGKITNTAEDSVKVKAIDLGKFLQQFSSVDFLKIDIEGAEIKLLPHIATELHKVKNIFLEFHSFNDQPQYLAEVIQALTSQGHRIYIDNIHFKNAPFINKAGKYGMDLQLNIFAYKN